VFAQQLRIQIRKTNAPKKVEFRADVAQRGEKKQLQNQQNDWVEVARLWLTEHKFEVSAIITERPDQPLLQKGDKVKVELVTVNPTYDELSFRVTRHTPAPPPSE